MKRLVASIVLLAAVMPGGNAVAGSTTYTKPYVGGPPPYSYLNWCYGQYVPAELNAGMVCFERVAGTSVTVGITDDSGLPVAGYVVFIHPDEDGWIFGPKVCGETVRTLLPRGWTRMYVHIASAVEAFDWCGTSAYAGVAGTVQATFRTS